MKTFDALARLFSYFMIVTAIAAPIASLPAAAQSDPDELVSAMFSRTPPAAMAFAQCLVKRDRMKVEHTLALYGHSKKYYNSMVSLIRPECVVTGQQQLTVLVPVLRGILFAALYTADYAKTRPILSKTKIDFARDFSDPKSEDARQSRELRSIAQCILRGDSSSTIEWVLGQSSDKVDEITKRIRPLVYRCSTKFVGMDFAESTLVGLLSEVLYRETVAALPVVNDGVS